LKLWHFTRAPQRLLIFDGRLEALDVVVAVANADDTMIDGRAGAAVVTNLTERVEFKFTLCRD